jgi:hypothetical protein
MVTVEGSRDEVTIGGASCFLEEVDALGIWLWSIDKLEVMGKVDAQQ